MWFLTPLLNMIGGPIVKGLIDAYKAKLDAGNTRERIAADLAAREMALQERERELATNLTIAHEGRWWTALPRAIVTYSFALFVAKAVVYDNLLGLGTTDPMRGDLATVFLWCMSLWFGGRTLEKVVSTLRR